MDLGRLRSRRGEQSGGSAGSAGEDEEHDVEVGRGRTLRNTRELGTALHETMAAARRKNRSGRPVDQPEVHIVGEITGVSGLGTGISVNFRVNCDDDLWELIEGEEDGQTQVDYPGVADDMAVLAHPLDLHFRANSLQGWPRIVLQVWRMDEVGSNELMGYALVPLPSTAGRAELSVPLWRPTGTLAEELAGEFLGAKVQLRSDAVVDAEAWEKRLRLVTTSEGRVHLDVSVLLRHFDKFDVDM